MIDETARPGLPEIDRLRKRLATILAKEEVADWLQRPNPAFENLKPLEVVERGEIDRLWQMIYYLESGTPV